MADVINQETIERAIGPIEKYRHQCHAASLALVKSGVLPGGEWRVARGWARGVRSQHSWAVQGDPFDRRSHIVDITMWSYQQHIPKVYSPPNLTDHEPHGWGWLVPAVIEDPSTPLLDLPYDKLNDEARTWLQMRYPNGIGWQDFSRLVSGPLLGWPSAEIVRVVSEDKKFSAIIPIDVVGLLTDKNPGGLYF